MKEKYSETTAEEWAVQIGTAEISRAAFIKMCREDAPDLWERLYNSKSGWHRTHQGARSPPTTTGGT